MQQPTFRTFTLHINSRRSRRTVTGLFLFLAIAFLGIGILATRSVLSHDSNHAMDGNGKPQLYASRGSVEAQTTTSNLMETFFYFLTDFNLSDLRSLLNWQIPSMAVSNVQLLTTNPADTKFSANPPQDNTIPSATINKTIGGSTEHNKPTNPAQNQPPGQTQVQTSQKPEVYIYHTHNREAFLPELPNVKNADDAYDATKNITKYGDTLTQELKTLRIPTLHTTDDYWTMGPYWNAYQYSRKTVEQVLKQHSGLKMVIDLHRDSDPRSVTTTTVNGKSTAGVYIIIGGMNPRHAQNEQLANTLKAEMDNEYPGLCRGIWRKTSTQYDTIYNQDLSPNSVLLELGGPENTPTELNLAVDDLAHVIANVLKK